MLLLYGIYYNFASFINAIRWCKKLNLDYPYAFALDLKHDLLVLFCAVKFLEQKITQRSRLVEGLQSQTFHASKYKFYLLEANKVMSMC